MPFKMFEIPRCQFDNPERPRDPESHQKDRDRVYGEIAQLGGEVVIDQVVYPNNDGANGSLGTDYDIIVARISGEVLADYQIK